MIYNTLAFSLSILYSRSNVLGPFHSVDTLFCGPFDRFEIPSGHGVNGTAALSFHVSKDEQEGFCVNVGWYQYMTAYMVHLMRVITMQSEDFDAGFQRLSLVLG